MVEQGAYGTSQFDQLLSYLDRLGPDQLRQVGIKHQNDLAVMSAISHITNQRQQMAQAVAAQQAMATPPMPPVNQQIIARAGQTPQVPPQMMEAGLAALPAENLETMSAADGGIVGGDSGYDMAVGYADGGEVESYQRGGTTDAKQRFIEQYKAIAEKVSEETGVDRDLLLAQWGLETAWGTKTVGKYNLGNIKDVTGKGPKATDKLEGSRSAYKTYESPEAFAKDYASLLKRNFPGALNTGSDVGAFTQGLTEGKKGAYATDPDYGKKLATTLTGLVPVSSAQAAPVQPSAASQIPTSGYPQAPAAVKEEPGFFKRQAERLGLSEETQRNVANLNTALAGALGPAYIPSYVPSSGGILDLARRGGEAVYNKLFPAPGLSQAQIKAMQAAEAAQAPARAAEAAQMAGAMPGEAQAMAQSVRAAQAAQMPSRAEQIQTASLAREAGEAARLGQAARTTQTATQATTTPGLVAEGAGEKPFVPAPGDDSYNRAEKRRFIEQQFGKLDTDLSKKEILDATKKAAPEAGKKGWTNEDWLLLGFGLLQSKSPYFLQALGEAGMGVVKEKRAAAKEEREEAYRRALTRESEAKAAALESGSGDVAKATAYADKAFDNWLQGINANPLLKMNITPEQIEAKRQQYLREAYSMYKIPMPAGVGSAPTGAGAGTRLMYNPQTGKIE